MTTTMYPRSVVAQAGNEQERFSDSDQTLKLDGTTMDNYTTVRAKDTRSAGPATSTIVAVVAGSTAIQETTVRRYTSPPLDQDVLIAGSVTMNIRMAESVVAVNAQTHVRIERVNSQGAYVETVVDSARGVEMGTAEAAQNWSVSATDTQFYKGDRISVRIGFVNIGTMGAGSVTFWVDGPTLNASGDTWIQFTETFGFLDVATTTFGTTLYFLDAASAVDPNGATWDAKEAWTARGASNATAVTATVNGWTAPFPMTKTSGGNNVEWYTRPLTAFTLSGLVLLSIRLNEDAGQLANATPRCQIAVCNADGTIRSGWAGTTSNGELAAASTLYTMAVAGPDIDVADGERLRIRMYVDDAQTAAMATGFTATMGYNGAAASAGDALLTFSQTISEYTPAAPKELKRRMIHSQAVRRASQW